MRTNIRYILLTALRDWLFFALLFGILAATFISQVMGGTALLEPEQMTLSFTAASARVMLMVSVIVFVCFHVRSAFDSKEIDLLLSRPISRTNLVLSYAIGFGVVSTLHGLAAIGAVWYAGPLNGDGFLAWSVSLILEGWLIVMLSLFASLTLRSAVFSVLATFGIYTLARMMGFFTMTVKKASLFEEASLNAAVKFGMNAISTVIPRLDFFMKSSWLIYGVESYNEISRFMLQGTIFIALLLCFAIFDFRRRQF